MHQRTENQFIISLGQAAIGHASKLGLCRARAFRVLLGMAFALVGLAGLAGVGQAIAQTDADAESSVVTIAAERSEFVLGIDDVVFTLARTGPVDAELYAAVGLSQTQDLSDALPGTMLAHFDAGAPSTRFVLDRTFFSDTATLSGDVTATLPEYGDYTIGTPSSATVRMVVVDPAMTARMEQASYRFVEGASATSVVVLARTAAGLPQPNRRFYVGLVTREVQGGATASTDYAPLSEQLKFAPSDFARAGDAWQARKEVLLTILDDTVDETGEALDVVLGFLPGNPGRTALVEADGHTACGSSCVVPVTIMDNDATPSAPRDLTLEPDDGEVALGWEAPADVGGSAVTKYQYRVSADDGATWAPDWTDIAHSAPGQTNSTTYLVTGLDSETTYRFELRAVNATGPGASAAGTVTTPTTPTIATTVTIAAGRSEFVLGIDDVVFTLARTGPVDAELYAAVGLSQTQDLSDALPGTMLAHFDAGAPSTRFVLDRTFFSDTATLSGDVTATLPEYGDYTIGTPSSATVRMVVVDPAMTARMEQASYRFVEGASATSVVVLARTAAGLPQPNRRFYVGLVTREVQGGATASTDYAPLSEQLKFAPSDFARAGDAWQARKEVLLTILDDTVDETGEALDVVLGFLPGNPGRTALVEADGHTACGSSCVVPVTIMDNDATPSAPRDLTLEPDDGEVALGWEAPADVGGSAVTKYQYRVSADDGATWAPDWTDIAHSAPGQTNSTTYLVTGLDSETTYRFELRAVNATGPGASAAGTVTTPTTPTIATTVTIAAGRSEFVLGIDDVVFTLARTGPVDAELYAAVGLSQTQDLSDAFPVTMLAHFDAGAPSTRFVLDRTFFSDTATLSGDVTATLPEYGDYTIGTPSSATVRMVVVDPAVTVRMEQASYRFAEGQSGTSVVVVARTAAGLPQPNREFEVRLFPVGSVPGGAGATDIAPLDELLEFSPSDFTSDGDAWQARKEVLLTILDDTIDEPDEMLNLGLHAVPGNPRRVAVWEADGTAACADRRCIVPVTIVDNDELPSAPQGLTLTPGVGTVALGWEAPADVGGSAVTKYQYRVSADDGATWAPDWTDIAHSAPGQTNSTTYLVTGLDSETTYRFELRAVNATGPGASAAGTVTTPTTPTIATTVTIAAGRSEFVLGIDDVVFTLARTGPVDAELYAAVGLSQTQDLSDAFPVTMLAHFGAGAPSTRFVLDRTFFSDTATLSGDVTATLPEYGDYTIGTPSSATVRMVVVDPAVTVRMEQASYRFAEGQSGTSVVVVARTAAGLPQPNREFEVRLFPVGSVPGGAGATDIAPLDELLEFSPSDFTSDGDAWQARKEVLLTILDDTIDEPDEMLNLGLHAVPGNPRRVAVWEADGTAACADRRCIVPVTIVDNDELPSAPQGLTLTPGVGTVALGWEAPADVGGSAVTKYQYRVSADDGATWAPDWTDIAHSAPGQTNSTTYLVTGLDSETTYRFELRAVNATGPGASAAGTVTTPTTPTTPTTVTIAAGRSEYGLGIDDVVLYSDPHGLGGCGADGAGAAERGWRLSRRERA